MDIEKLIDRLGENTDCWTDKVHGYADLRLEAATTLSTLQAENARLRADLEYEREHANAYLEECGQWEAENEKMLSDLRRLQTERDTLLAANQHLLAEREQLTAERDAAVSDVSAILAEVEEIRRGYGVDNADADAAFADLCGNYCAKCSNNCYEEAEDYRCKNYEWRGIKED